MQSNEPHPLYPERANQTVTVRGQAMPGWFTGQAAIWTGGTSPRIIGPFEDCKAALNYMSDTHPGGQVFPYDEPEV
jgi:hypothetical protein